MGQQYICGGTKYFVKKQTIGLPINITDLPETLQIGGLTLLRRSAFHVSLIAIGELIKKHRIAIPDFENKITEEFCRFTHTHDVDFDGYTGEYRLAADGERRSVVALYDIKNLAELYEHLNQKFQLHLEVPPAHVTLYTLQLDKGIFIVDKSDLLKRSRQTENPDINL